MLFPATEPGFLCLTIPLTQEHITNCIYLKINRYNSLNIAVQISHLPNNAPLQKINSYKKHTDNHLRWWIISSGVDINTTGGDTKHISRTHYSPGRWIYNDSNMNLRRWQSAITKVNFGVNAEANLLGGGALQWWRYHESNLSTHASISWSASDTIASSR